MKALWTFEENLGIALLTTGGSLILSGVALVFDSTTAALISIGVWLMFVGICLIAMVSERHEARKANPETEKVARP